VKFAIRGWIARKMQKTRRGIGSRENKRAAGAVKTRNKERILKIAATKTAKKK